MKKRIVALSVPAVAIALVLAGCGSSSSKTSNKVLNTTAQANVETVDPNRVTDVGSDLAVTQTVEGCTSKITRARSSLQSPKRSSNRLITGKSTPLI
ncbi:hypothetical protein [Secundilactobacillus collinoides]|uniref:hypothetical protein n=1 Tax=Secundilactobacillus collinoides TaxID=33960 RepID=UPI000B1C83F4|nr:hypothetical protein [Secundilactobacillus collinoides]